MIKSIGSHQALRLYPVIISAGAVGLSIGLTIPLTSLVLENRGFSILVVGLNTTLYSLAILTTGPFIPGWINRLGMIQSMRIGALVSGLLVTALAFSTNIWTWFLFRSIMGIAGALHWVASEAWINAAAAAENRGRIVGAYATLWGLGIAAGPLVLKLTGVTGLVPFFTSGAIMACAALPLLMVSGKGGRIGDRTAPLVFHTITTAPFAMAAGLICGLLETAALALLPLYGLHSGLDTARTLTLVSLFAVGSFLFQPLVGWAADRIALKNLLRGIAVVAVLAVVMIPVTLHLPLVIGSCLFLWGGSIGGFYTLGMMHLGQRFSGTHLTAASSMFVMAYTTGMVGGPFLGGVAMQLYDPNGLLIMMMVIPIFFLAGMQWSPKARHSSV